MNAGELYKKLKQRFDTPQSAWHILQERRTNVEKQWVEDLGLPENIQFKTYGEFENYVREHSLKTNLFNDEKLGGSDEGSDGLRGLDLFLNLESSVVSVQSSNVLSQRTEEENWRAELEREREELRLEREEFEKYKNASITSVQSLGEEESLPCQNSGEKSRHSLESDSSPLPPLEEQVWCTPVHDEKEDPSEEQQEIELLLETVRSIGGVSEVRKKLDNFKEDNDLALILDIGVLVKNTFKNYQGAEMLAKVTEIIEAARDASSEVDGTETSSTARSEFVKNFVQGRFVEEEGSEKKNLMQSNIIFEEIVDKGSNLEPEERFEIFTGRRVSDFTLKEQSSFRILARLIEPKDVISWLNLATAFKETDMAVQEYSDFVTKYGPRASIDNNYRNMIPKEGICDSRSTVENAVKMIYQISGNCEHFVQMCNKVDIMKIEEMLQLLTTMNCNQPEPLNNFINRVNNTRIPHELWKDVWDLLLRMELYPKKNNPLNPTESLKAWRDFVKVMNDRVIFHALIEQNMLENAPVEKKDKKEEKSALSLVRPNSVGLISLLQDLQAIVTSEGFGDHLCNLNGRQIRHVDLVSLLNCEHMESWPELISYIQNNGGPFEFWNRLKDVEISEFIKLIHLLTEAGFVHKRGYDDEYQINQLELFCNEIIDLGGATKFLWAIRNVDWYNFNGDLYKIKQWRVGGESDDHPFEVPFEGGPSNATRHTVNHSSGPHTSTSNASTPAPRVLKGRNSVPAKIDLFADQLPSTKKKVEGKQLAPLKVIGNENKLQNDTSQDNHDPISVQDWKIENNKMIKKHRHSFPSSSFNKERVVSHDTRLNNEDLRQQPHNGPYCPIPNLQYPQTYKTSTNIKPGSQISSAVPIEKDPLPHLSREQKPFSLPPSTLPGGPVDSCGNNTPDYRSDAMTPTTPPYSEFGYPDMNAGEFQYAETPPGARTPAHNDFVLAHHQDMPPRPVTHGGEGFVRDVNRNMYLETSFDTDNYNGSYDNSPAFCNVLQLSSEKSIKSVEIASGDDEAKYYSDDSRVSSGRSTVDSRRPKYSQFQKFDEWAESMITKMPQGAKVIETLVHETVQFMNRLTGLALEHSIKSNDSHRVYELLISTLRCLDERFFTVIGWREIPYLQQALHLILETNRRKLKLKHGLSFEFNIGPKQYKDLVNSLKTIGLDEFLLGLKFLNRVPERGGLLNFYKHCELIGMIHELGLSQLTRAQWQSIAVTLKKSNTVERHHILEKSNNSPFSMPLIRH